MGSVKKSTRERKPPARFGEWTSLCIDSKSEPRTIEEALNGNERKLWTDAMETEMKSMYENNVWTLVECPNDRKIIGSRWVYKRKIGSDGKISSYKARLVAQGYNQIEGIDYEDTFSPVVRYESVRVVVALAIHYDLIIHQMDVSSAFLNGELKETIYMRQPPGFVEDGKENLVCKLEKSLYGLKQSPKCWNYAINSFLIKLDFQQSKSDSCLYIRNIDDIICILAIYVDDIIIASHSESQLNHIKSSLCNQFQMKDLGLLKYFLGVNIVQGHGGSEISLNQSAYTEGLLDRFQMSECNAVQTPMDSSLKLEKANENSKLIDTSLYQSAVGALLYLSTRTRPDIAFAVSKVSRYCSMPTDVHWLAVKRILIYLKGTVNYGIVYTKSSVLTCIGYSDADWAGELSDRKSTSGYCFFDV